MTKCDILCCLSTLPLFIPVQPIDKGLEDKNPYVRRTAVMGVLKLYHIDPQVVTIQGLMERVRRMIHVDPDPQVMERVSPDLTLMAEPSPALTLTWTLRCSQTASPS